MSAQRTQASGAPAPDRQSAGERLAAGRTHLIRKLLGSAPPSQEAGALPPAADFPAAYGKLMDTFFRERLEEVDPGRRAGKVALVAVGGYGRSELCLHSDVDILIVSPRRIPARALDLAQPLFLPLWDLGCDLGHGFRTIKDCMDLAAEDFQVFASLLDMRFVAGDPEVIAALEERLRKVLPRKRKRFMEWLHKGQERRLERHGAGVGRIEPQLKEGVGGLRDYHRMLWLGRFMASSGCATSACGDAQSLYERGLLNESESTLLDNAVRFLLATRTLLHDQTNRRTDVLHLDLQPDIAARMGFAASGDAPAVELFLAALHRCMADIRAMSGLFWRHALRPGPGGADPQPVEEETIDTNIMLRDGEVGFAAGYDPDADPVGIVRVFEQCAVHGAVLQWPARRLAAERTDLAEKLRDSGRAVAHFLQLLGSGNAFYALENMLETGFLGGWLPEFGQAQDLVQFDAYHTFPLGQHTLHTIRTLEEFGRDVPAGESATTGATAMLSELWIGLSAEDRLVALLAALFHDCGKTCPRGESHAEHGAVLAEEAMKRWGLDEPVRRDVAFLIREHLLLVHTSLRKDLSDESVVVGCMSRIGTLRRLRMLYLLTCADSMATGPKAWNDWTGRLLSELFHKGARVMAEGDLTSAATVRRQLRTRDTVRAMAPAELPHLSAQAVEQWLDAMGSRYSQAFEAEDIIRHIRLAENLERDVADEGRRLSAARSGQSSAVLHACPAGKSTEGEGVWEVALAAKDRPGLFATFAGVLALHGVNIFAADCYTWRNRTALDVFKVSPPPDPLYADEFWSRVKGSVRFALQGKLALDSRLADKERSPLGGSGPAVTVDGDVSVHIDNDATEFFTVIEVRAPDRLGLLYRIASTLHALQLDMRLAKVATHVDRILDVFYVRDAGGQKITAPDHIEEVRRALAHALSPAA